jgi:hypothetical protein
MCENNVKKESSKPGQAKNHARIIWKENFFLFKTGRGKE